MEKIIEANERHLHDLTEMGIALWPDNEFAELEKEFRQIVRSAQNKVFVFIENDAPVAFIHLSIRTDYVEGADSSPTGYIEGIYVKPECRKRGISRRMFLEGKMWLLEQGCRQVGSDIHIDNKVSYDFHTSIGFKEAGRLITFIQDL